MKQDPATATHVVLLSITLLPLSLSLTVVLMNNEDL